MKPLRSANGKSVKNSRQRQTTERQRRVQRGSGGENHQDDGQRSLTVHAVQTVFPGTIRRENVQLTGVRFHMIGPLHHT